MPILVAGFPVVTPPELPDLSKVDSRTLAFRALDGTYPFPSTGREFFFMPDLEGLDMPKVDLITRKVPGMDGELLSEIRVGRREIFLPLFIASDSTHTQYLDRRDDLAALFNHRRIDYRALGGTFDLVATSVRGERSLRCARVEGMTGAKWPGESSHWAKLGITAWAVQPYWRGVDWSTPIIRVPAGSSWFGVFPPDLSSSQAIGTNIPVVIHGDVDSWPVIEMIGPADSVLIEGAGIHIEIPEGLGVNEPAYIDTNPRSRAALFDNVSQWERVAPQRTLRALPPGRNLLTINLSDPAASSMARVSGPTLWERPW